MSCLSDGKNSDDQGAGSSRQRGRQLYHPGLRREPPDGRANCEDPLPWKYRQDSFPVGARVLLCRWPPYRRLPQPCRIGGADRHHETDLVRAGTFTVIQKLQQIPITLKILAFTAAGAAVLALAVGVGVMAALTLGSDGGSLEEAKPEHARGANPVQRDRSEDTGKKPFDAQSDDAYLNSLARIQKDSVEASLETNHKLLRYDGLTADDVEEVKANYVALESYARRAKDLAPSAEYENQYKVFVHAIRELRDADELAYHLAVNPSSATQTDFEAYDRHVARATVYLRRSNKLLGKDYKTTGAAQEVSLG